MGHFVRFRSKLRGPDRRTALGIFHTLDRLFEVEALSPWSVARVEEISDWFNLHLPVPRLRADDRRALFWFRSESRDMIQRLWELAILLEEQGTIMELVHTTRPGWVRYADDFQVAAIPTQR